MLEDGLRLDLQWNLVRIFFIFPDTFLDSQNAPGKCRVVAETDFPEKHTAFDQSLIPLSAVVKGCVLEIFGPNEEEAVWESLVQPGG